MAKTLTPFVEAYPPPWQIQNDEIVDCDGCHVHALDDIADADVAEFWRGIVEAVNTHHGHAAPVNLANDARPLADVYSPWGSGPVPIERREDAQ